MPSFDSYNNGKGIVDNKRKDLPSIKMDTADHRQTASFGNSHDARTYRAEQAKLISQGNMTAAIKMDVDDIHTKFGTKYDEGIRQAIRYAITEGWWNPWTGNIGNLSLLLVSVDLTLEEVASWSERN